MSNVPSCVGYMPVYSNPELVQLVRPTANQKRTAVAESSFVSTNVVFNFPPPSEQFSLPPHEELPTAASKGFSVTAHNNVPPAASEECRDTELDDAQILANEVSIATVHGDDPDGSSVASIAGETIGDTTEAEGDESETAVAAKRANRVAPKSPHQGDPAQPRQHSKWNAEPEVGNFGLFFGNWGTRATIAGNSAKRNRQQRQDHQILRSPGQVIVLAEATKAMEDLLI